MVKEKTAAVYSNLVDFFSFLVGHSGNVVPTGPLVQVSIYGLRSTATGAPVQERNNGQRLACVLYAA